MKDKSVNNFPISNMERYDWIDLGKGILMFFVFVFHGEAIFCGQHSWSFIFQPIRMSGFFFLSGYLFTRSIDSVSFRKKLMQVVRSVIIPYFVYMFIYFLPKLIFLSNDTTQSLIDILLFRASWFIPVMGIMQLLYGYILSHTPKIKAVFFNLGISIIFSVLFILLYREKPSWLVSTPFFSSSIVSGKFPFCINNACLASVFFGTGIIIRHYYNLNKLIKNWSTILIMILCFISIMLLDKHSLDSRLEISQCVLTNFPLPLIYAILGLFVLCCLCVKLQKISLLNYAGKNSLNFYYLNALMLRVCTILSAKLQIDSLLNGGGYAGVLIVAFMAYLLTFFVVLLINQYIPILTGRKDVYNKLSQRFGWNIKW